jgi:hypothetical protein
MRLLRTLFVSVLLIVSFQFDIQAQTYNITSNNNWTTKVGTGYCGTCTFKISPGVTFTIGYNGANCANCTFTGGTVVITNTMICATCDLDMDSLSVNAGTNTVSFQNGGDFIGRKVTINSPTVCQGCTFTGDTVSQTAAELQLQSPTTTFTNVQYTASGTSDIKETNVISISGSTFNFHNKSYFFNNGSGFTASTSDFYFGDTTYFKSTGSVTLENSSDLVAGNGSATTSAAYITMQNSVSIYDNSLIKLSNDNNYYTNSTSSYSSVTNSKTYSTAGITYNCNGTYANSCAGNTVYGCATMNSSGVSACTPLAVEQIALTANLTGSSAVQLSWSVSQNLNPDHFSVQRSADNQNWVTIGTVAGKGYGATDPDYTFTDPSPLSGTNIYRLLIVDIDGGVTYSKAVAVQFTAAPDAISIYPNPVTGQVVHLKVGSLNTVVVNVYTQTGQLLLLTSLSGQTQYDIRLPANVPHNNYLVFQVISHDRTQAFELFNE